MSWKDLNTYIQSIPSPFLEELFKHCDYPWSPLARLKSHIEKTIGSMKNQGSLSASRKILYRDDFDFEEGSYFIQSSDRLSSDFVDKELNICIKKGTLLEAGATIKNHTFIEKNCEIRQGAYLRGFAYIGEQSVIGHTTEIKNSIFVKHVEAGHFSYIGDTIVGSYVNLGAGTKISNLEFRSLDAKKNNTFPQLKLHIEGDIVATGISKFGAIIGDGCETGCNSVLCPLVLLGPKSWVMPNHCVYKGFYHRGSILRGPKR